MHKHCSRHHIFPIIWFWFEKREFKSIFIPCCNQIFSLFQSDLQQTDWFLLQISLVMHWSRSAWLQMKCLFRLQLVWFEIEFRGIYFVEMREREQKSKEESNPFTIEQRSKPLKSSQVTCIMFKRKNESLCTGWTSEYLIFIFFVCSFWFP